MNFLGLPYTDLCILLKKIYVFIAEKRKIQQYSEWRQLWHPNFDDYNRAEAIVGAENNTSTNVTVQLGATAYLHCHVRSSADRALAGAEV